MRDLMDKIKSLDEMYDAPPKADMNTVARELEEVYGTVTLDDLDVYSDGQSYAIMHKPTEDVYLYAVNDENEWELEEAEVSSWPPKALYGAVATKVHL